MLTDSCSKSRIGSGTQMYRERVHTEVCSNPAELFYVWRQMTFFFFFKCFSFNVKRHLSSKPDGGGWHVEAERCFHVALRSFWLAEQLALKLRSTKAVTWVAKYCKTDIVWKPNVLSKQKTNTPTFWGLDLKAETRVVTSFNCGQKFLVWSKWCSDRRVSRLGFCHLWVFFPREWYNQTLRLYWFKLINPLIEDVDSAALERLK